MVAGLFTGLVLSRGHVSFLNSYDIHLFFTVSVLYLVFGLASSVAIRFRWPGFNTQIVIQLSADILALTLLMHAARGVSSGLGFLLLTPVAGSGLLMSRRLTLLFAAIAALAVLGEQVYAEWLQSFTTYYAQAGMLGLTLFATALLAHLLVQRARRSEALAEQRGVDLANMSQLTDYVINRMQTGAVVMDNSHRVWLMNAAAKRLLEVTDAPAKPYLRELCPELGRHWQHWVEGSEPEPLRAVPGGARILPRFARLGEGEQSGALIFLEDLAALEQQAQQLKLASLGRLTASIAHEVRNPLGAISYAAQLLAENRALSPGDARLIEIICAPSSRMNEIIENVLQLSRRESSHIQELVLKPWLTDFVGELKQGYPAAQVGLDVQPADMKVRVDPLHLRQVLYNLCQNGLRYSSAQTGKALLKLSGRMIENTPVLDTIDDGPGIPLDRVEQIFEPFFTTEPRGTGLGLYIARELCEANQARLSYFPAPTGGSCFRISFSAGLSLALAA
jgi:two-component system sensor histidine kinase PilS (NtrC family)